MQSQLSMVCPYQRTRYSEIPAPAFAQFGSLLSLTVRHLNVLVCVGLGSQRYITSI